GSRHRPVHRRSTPRLRRRPRHQRPLGHSTGPRLAQLSTQDAARFTVTLSGNGEAARLLHMNGRISRAPVRAIQASRDQLLKLRVVPPRPFFLLCPNEAPRNALKPPPVVRRLAASALHRAGIISEAHAPKPTAFAANPNRQPRNRRIPPPASTQNTC